jgi:hypothetical protein
MCDQQVVHVGSVLFLHDQNPFLHRACGGVTLANVPNQLSVVVDRDALGDQIFLNHFYEIVRLPIFGSGPRREAGRVKVWFST